MTIREILWNAAGSDQKRALPILSFPAVQKLGVTVDEFLHDAEKQADGIRLIAEETDTLAAVSMMDLSVEAEAFGASVRYSAHEVPAVTGQLITCQEDAENLNIPDVMSSRTGLFVEAVRKAKQSITGKPVLSGMIGPFSLAGRLMDVTEIMYTCYDEPESVHTVLEKVTEFLIAYAKAMKETGSDGIVMAEPLAGILNPSLMAEFSLPYVKRIIEAVQDDSFGVVYHNCGGSVPGMLKEIFSQGAVAYHFGNAVDLEQILRNAPADALCMGNIDPVARFVSGTPDEMKEAVRDLLDRCGSYKNFVLSSGCDIPATASWENIKAFFDAAKAYRA